MSSTRTWAVGTAVVSILLVVASWFLMIGPKRGEAADLRTQKVTQDAANAKLNLDIAQLKAQFASLPAKQAELQVIQRQLPDNPALPTLIRSLTSIAGASGATLFEVAPGQPVAATVSAPTTTGVSAPATGSTAPGTVSAASGATAPATASLVRIPVVVTVHGTYAESELFLQKLQTSMTRALLVEQLAIKPSAVKGSNGSAATSTQATGDSLETVITGSVFVLPDQPKSSSTTAGAATGATTTGSAS